MNNALIQIIEHNGQRAVNARELHAFLDNKRQFADWIKQRIEQYGFVKNQDYEVFHNFVKRETGGSTRIEYALSLDMAKELSMVENNEKGRMARKYFIQCEKRLQQPKASSLLEDRLKAATWAVGFLNMNESSRLKLAKAVLDPLGLPSPDYVPSKGLMHSATALLKKHGVKMSSAAFNKVLEKFGIIERKTREGRTGKIHKWAWLPDKHSQYGENVVSPECPNQTQIQWYDDRFLDVLDIAGIKY